MNSYIDFDYYSNFYDKPKVSKEDFNQLALDATNNIRSRIMNKSIVNYEKIVKDTTCLIVDVLSDISQLKARKEKLALGNEKILSSEKVGDYSRTFSSVSINELNELISSKEKEIDDLITKNLLFTGLLYTGVYVIG